MAKQSGIGASLFVGVYDISGDVGAVTSMEISRGTFDVTPINASAMERIVGRRDGAMSFTGFFNATSGQSHPVLSALPRTDVIASCFIGSTLGYHAASVVAKEITYAPTLGDDGSLAISSNLLANGYGLEWGEMLTTGKQTLGTGTVNGTSIDGSASSSYACAAYLQVFSIASGTMGVKLQDSANNTDFDDITGMTFTNVTGATTQRLQGAAGATVRRYVRLVTSGVHGDAVMAVNFVRYTEAGPV